MHETTQRRLCIALFFALCVLPTATVIGTLLSRSLPGRLRGFEAELSDRLGLAVKLDAVSYPRPGVTLMLGVQLTDPETSVPVARVRACEITRRRGRSVILMSQPELQGDQLERLCQLVHDRVLKQHAGVVQSCTLAARELTIHHGDGAETLTEIRCDVDSGSAESRATARFRLAGAGLPKPARLVVTRNRQNRLPTTRVEFHTGEAPLPCSLLSCRFPALAHLGAEAQFFGSVWGMQTSAGWAGEVAGRLLQVDLDQLVSQRFPHRLSGRCDLVIDRARFHAGRLHEAAGSLAAGPGVASRSLLAGATVALGLTPTPVLRNREDEIVPFQQLAAAFAVGDEGLTIRGQCSGTPGTILVDADGPLLREAAHQPLPVVGLVRALVPHNQVLVPATRETDTLLRALPLPTVVVPPLEDARAPRGHLRFSEAPNVETSTR